jgi:DNA-binding MurR/RpiR family transcriptional regulator
MRRAGQLWDFVQASLSAIPPADLDAAVDLLCDTSRRLVLAGGRFSRVVAEYLALHLQQVRPKVRLLDEPLGRNLDNIVDLGRRDVYLLCDFHRYQRSTVELARYAGSKGATIILVTDERLSPAAADADVVLPASVASSSPFHSMASAFVLAELLVIPVLDRLGAAGRARMSRWEEVRGHEILG